MTAQKAGVQAVTCQRCNPSCFRHFIMSYKSYLVHKDENWFISCVTCFVDHFINWLSLAGWWCVTWNLHNFLCLRHWVWCLYMQISRPLNLDSEVLNLTSILGMILNFDIKILWHQNQIFRILEFRSMYASILRHPDIEVSEMSKFIRQYQKLYFEIKDNTSIKLDILQYQSVELWHWTWL